jgi:hypothetical protein
VRCSGEKGVRGLSVGATETEAFWREFCPSLSRRGLMGVQLVISDAHEGGRLVAGVRGLILRLSGGMNAHLGAQPTVMDGRNCRRRRI